MTIRMMRVKIEPILFEMSACTVQELLENTYEETLFLPDRFLRIQNDAGEMMRCYMEQSQIDALNEELTEWEQ